MRRRSFKLTAKQRGLIGRMLADARLDVYAAAGLEVDQAELIRWISDPEFQAALDNVLAVQQVVLRQRATVREFGGGGSGRGEGGRGRGDTGTPGFDGELSRTGRGEGEIGETSRAVGEIEPVRETAKPQAEPGQAAEGALKTDGSGNGPARRLSAEEFDEMCRRAKGESGSAPDTGGGM